MSQNHRLPADIERTSMAILSQELEDRGILLPEELAPIVKRVIHATADFDFAASLVFTENFSSQVMECMRRDTAIVTDTNMILSGISKQAAAKLGIRLDCYMARPETAALAKELETTRAAASIRLAAKSGIPTGFAVGNAPTALMELCRQMEQGYRPLWVLAVPVGFVNVVESKELVLSACRRYGIPAAAALGRKGGSTVAAAMCNALLYQKADLLEPSARGWQG